MKHTFSGGIVIPPAKENKALTAALPIEEWEPDRLRIPLRQSPGPALLPAVQPGDKVKIGQRVGHPAGDSGVPVHCGVSGTVTAVEEGSGPFGPGPVVFIENDHQRAEAPLLPAAEGRQGLRMLMREAGLIGMGGAGFPTYRKYDTDRGIRTLLINGGECEPYLTCDDRLMVFEARKVVTGALAMARAVAAPGGGAPQLLFCVEKDKAQAVTRLQEALRGDPKASRARVIVLPHRYPQGGERQLIQAVLGWELGAGVLPAQAGVLVSNVATAAAMADALQGHPLTHRIVTVSGKVGRPGNYRVPVGTLLADLLAHAGGALPESERDVLVSGGPMTGRLIQRGPSGPAREEVVLKTTGGLLALAREDGEEHPCIRCGGCARVCPSRLMPFVIDAAAIAGDSETCVRYHADQCIACGCCSYICPAYRRLAARVSMAREGIRARARRASS